MKTFLFICLAVGWASTDKLDRSYLPPPGSKFSGGTPGDIQAPLEYPKLNYSTGRPQVDGVPEIELGINRRPAGTVQGSTQRPDGFTFFQKSYAVPKTTTSYAITQTTTFPPGDYEELDQSSGFLNASISGQQIGLPKYPQSSGLNYQQRQPIRAQLPSQGPDYNQYQQGQNFQSTLAPYGSTTQRPQFVNNQNPRAYLPPVPSSNYNGQAFADQDSVGYPSGQPQGPKYQDGQRFTSTTRPGLVEGAKQQNVLIGNPTTTAPQFEDESYSSTAGPFVNQQRFGSRLPTQQNQRFQGNQNLPSSTASPVQFTTSNGPQQNIYTGQNIPSSTSMPQYQYGQRFTTPGSNQQRFGSQVPHQNQNNYPGNQKFPSTATAPQYQEGQQFVTPGLVQQNQNTRNQDLLSTPYPQYQDSQRYTTPETIQEGFIPNQQKFGLQNPSQDTQYKYGNQNFPSSTAAPQLQNGQRFTTPGAVQQQQNQYPGNQNFPSSTTAPQYSNEQRYTTVGSNEQIGSLAPAQQNQNQYPGNQFLPSTTEPHNQNQPSQQGSRFGSPEYTQQNQYRGNQNIPSSIGRPQYQNGQFVMPGLVEQNQYSGGQNIPSTATPQIQNGQRIPGPGFGFNQANYPDSQTIVENGNQQYPSSAAPQYQSTLSPISGSSQGFIPNQQNPQYPGRPGYNQQFPSTISPQGLPQQQYGDNGVQTLPGTGVTYPAVQGTPSTQTLPGYENKPSSPTNTQVYGTTSSTPGYYNESIPNVPTGPLGSTGIFGENRPERPNAASDRTAEIISYDNVLTPEGYSYSYDTSNGIHADESGIVDDGTKAQGSFSYIGDDGKVYSVIYSADENGFQPRGDHLPTPPPIPEAIQRVIEQANRDKESGILDDGLYDEDKYGHMKYDGSVSSFRPRNKTTSLINGADIPNSYESRIGGKNRNQLKNKPNFEEDNREFDEEGQTDKKNFDDINDNDNDRRISNTYPATNQGLTNVNRRKMQKGKIYGDENIDSIKTKQPVTGKDIVRRPVSSKMKEDGVFENVLVTDVEEDSENMDGSQDYDEESDLVNYRDDPNSRTNFHGVNRYLPNPKGSNRFNQTDGKRLLVRPNGTKQKNQLLNKSERTGNRKNQATQDVIPESEEEIKNDGRIRIPSRNKIGQKKIESSTIFQQDLTESNDEPEANGDDALKVNGKFASDDKLESSDRGIPTQSGEYPINKKIEGKLKGLNVNERTGVSKHKNVKTVSDEETGYEYVPPQRKFNSEGSTKFPSRTSVTGKPQFPSQGTTVRPFMTPNVYGDDKSEENYDDKLDSERKPNRPISPTKLKDQNNPENLQGNDRYNDNTYLDMTQKGFDATRKPTGSFGTPSRRPFGRPQTTVMPSFKDEDTTRQQIYNDQGPLRPDNKVIYGVNVPNKGLSNTESSTTLSPNSGYESFIENQRPGQYQDTNIPNESYFEGVKESSEDGKKPTPYRPGITNSRGQVPSTTFRPSYTFDKTLSPSGPIAVDGYGRPISSSNAPMYGTTFEPVTQNSRITIENRPDKTGPFRSNERRFGVTPAPTRGTTGYQGSTPGPLEDFSGPKQPQRFDPDTGYYY